MRGQSRDRFAAIPEWVLRDPIIIKPPSNLIVYTNMCLLANYRDRTGETSQEEISLLTGLSRSVVFKAFKELRKAQIIVPRSDGMYDLPLDRPCGKLSQDSDYDRILSQNWDGLSQDSDQDVSGLRPSPISTEVDSELFPETRVPTREELFDRIWERYPRKMNKKAALDAFKARCESGATIRDLAMATEHYRQSVVGVQQTYILHGSTFFGPSEPWHDYLDAPHPEQHVTIKPRTDGEERTFAQLVLDAERMKL